MKLVLTGFLLSVWTVALSSLPWLMELDKPGPNFDPRPQVGIEEFSVIGTSFFDIEPDQVLLRLEVEVEGEPLEDTYPQFRSSLEAASRVLKTYGVQPHNIQLDEFGFNTFSWRGPSHGLDPDAWMWLDIVVDASDENGRMLDELGRIENVNADLENYINSDEDDLQLKADALAVEDAVRQAKQTATLAGLRLGPVLSISNEIDHRSGVVSDRFGVVEEILVTASRTVPLRQGMIEYRSEMTVTFQLLPAD